MPAASQTLPTIGDRPHADVLIFDGQCRFCLANVSALHRVDAGKIAYISLHDAEVQRRWPDLTYEALMEQIYLIDGQGRRYPGAAALRCLSTKLPCLWPLAPLLHLPGSLPCWQFCYRQIAKIRYRFGRLEQCEGGTCDLHFGRKKQA